MSFTPVGAQAQARVALGGSFNCPPPVESVTATVRDTAGRELSATATLAAGEPAADVTFTPDSPGLYTVEVSFHPNAGSARVDLLAVRDVTAREVATFSASCDSVQRLAGGDWLCDSTLFRATDRYALGVGGNLIVSGDVIWSAEIGEIRRWDIGPSGAPPAPAALSITVGTAAHLAASATELYVTSSTGVDRFVFSNGAIAAAGRIATLPADAEATLPTPSGALVFTRVPDVPNRSQVCPYTRAQDAFASSGDCQVLPGFLSGVGPDGVWLFRPDPAGSTGTTPSTGTIYFLPLAGDALAEPLFMRLPQGYTHRKSQLTGLSSEALGAAGGTPFVAREQGGFQLTVFGARVEEGRIVLELFGEHESASSNIGFAATAQYAWTLATSTTRVLQRGP